MAEGGVKCRVNGVLEKLKDCFGELHGIMTDGPSSERSDLVSTVREMVGALETGLKSVSEKQEDDAKLKRMRSDPGICTGTCVHHPEIVNLELWTKLPKDLVGEVFARLPIPWIIELRKSSADWAAMSDSKVFKDAFARANPKLFGLVEWDRDWKIFRTRILDGACTEWHAINLDFPKADAYILACLQGNGHSDAVYACDGGLVCFVPEWKEDDCEDEMCPDCVFVCNPLTNAWRELRAPWESNPRALVIVQLVTHNLSYCVHLVYSHDGHTFEAFVYDSRVKSWSMKSSGLVYGNCNSLLYGRSTDPLVFDCATKQLINLGIHAIVQVSRMLRSSISKDRLFVLHVLTDRDLPLRSDDIGRIVISEFTLESSWLDLRKLNDYDVPFRALPGRHAEWARRHGAEIFTSTGFILSTWDNQFEDDSAYQLIRIYDVSAAQWRDLPPLIGDLGIQYKSLECMFMCELRWDVHP